MQGLRRHGAVGVRRGIRSPGGIPATVASIAGDTLRAHYRGDVFTEGGLGPPDVVTADNIEGTSGFDVTQATGSNQPHSGTVLGFPGFDFDVSAGQNLRAQSAAGIGAAGDDYTLLIVAQIKSQPGTDIVMEIGKTPVTNSSGIMLYYTTTQINAFCKTTSGNKTASADFSEHSAIHVLESRLDSAGLTLGVDGTEVLVAGSFGGVLNDLDAVGLGSGPDGALDSDVVLFEVVALANPSAAVIASLRAFLGAHYGVTMA